ncbi:MAG: hypothetical protein LBL61_06835 [Elusimicrobiota bacterium]|nr:hypothetical protein [Elusimicrobiota bacterium]
MNASHLYKLVHGEYPCYGISGFDHETFKKLDIDMQLDDNGYTKDGKYYIFYNGCSVKNIFFFSDLSLKQIQISV